MVEALTWWAQPRGGCRPAERKCWGSPGRMVTGSGGVVKGPHSGVWEASRVALWARLGVEPGDGAHHLPTELPPRLWGDCRCWGSDANGPRSAAPARPPRRGDLSLPQVPPQLPVLPPQCVCFPLLGVQCPAGIPQCCLSPMHCVTVGGKQQVHLCLLEAPGLRDVCQVLPGDGSGTL